MKTDYSKNSGHICDTLVLKISKRLFQSYPCRLATTKLSLLFPGPCFQWKNPNSPKPQSKHPSAQSLFPQNTGSLSYFLSLTVDCSLITTFVNTHAVLTDTVLSAVHIFMLPYEADVIVMSVLQVRKLKQKAWVTCLRSSSS